VHEHGDADGLGVHGEGGGGEEEETHGFYHTGAGRFERGWGVAEYAPLRPLGFRLPPAGLGGQVGGASPVAGESRY
jgi:hypothetical protein